VGDYDKIFVGGQLGPKIGNPNADLPLRLACIKSKVAAQQRNSPAKRPLTAPFKVG
jgi:hypothetical protein